jgi:hypothetical protein
MDDTIKAAADHLANRVYRTAFFDKLASEYGIRPNGPADESQLLEAAAILREQHDQAQKQAAETGTPFLTAALNGLKKAAGVNPQVVERQSADRAKAASVIHLADPKIAEAADTFANYLATLA